MTVLHLDVRTDAYELRFEGEVLGTLDGGAVALLSGAGERVREIDIEVAIEHAEEWLMPSSKRWQGSELHINDATGRIRTMLGEHASLTIAQVEQEFDRMHRAVIRGSMTDRDAAADTVLVRELTHHGRLSRVVVE